jgi:hypothetical protein
MSTTRRLATLSILIGDSVNKLIRRTPFGPDQQVMSATKMFVSP